MSEGYFKLKTKILELDKQAQAGTIKRTELVNFICNCNFDYEKDLALGVSVRCLTDSVYFNVDPILLETGIINILKDANNAYLKSNKKEYDVLYGISFKSDLHNAYSFTVKFVKEYENANIAKIKKYIKSARHQKELTIVEEQRQLNR